MTIHHATKLTHPVPACLQLLGYEHRPQVLVNTKEAVTVAIR